MDYNILSSHVFQSTLPSRERLAIACNKHLVCIFQSTLPSRERHKKTLRKLGKAVFQSTLPSRERRFAIARAPLVADISIHAPKPGATHCKFRATYISINFNPRSQAGSD